MATSAPVSLSRDDLKWLRDQAVLTMDNPHVDLSNLLHTTTPVRLGLDDVHELLSSGEPAFHLEVGDTELTVRKADGGLLATLQLKW
jgi:hypothetical protein